MVCVLNIQPLGQPAFGGKRGPLDDLYLKETWPLGRPASAYDKMQPLVDLRFEFLAFKQYVNFKRA